MRSLEEQVLFIKMLEERIAEEYPKGEIRCPIHLSLGQEAAAVGIASQLAHKDLMVSTHRSHAHYLAKGGDPYKLIAELYGKLDGCSKGQGGSMHLVDWSVGFAGSTSIVGGTIPIGVGLAFAQRLKAENNVTAVCLGDAATEEGVFHEAANFASLHKLPVIFVIEDNDRSCYTRKKDRQPNRGFDDLAMAHDLNYHQANGEDVEDVAKAMASIIQSIKMISEPWLLDIEVESMVEHCGPTFEPGYKVEGTRPFSFVKEIDDLFQRARQASFPNENELGKYIYA